MHGPCKRIRQLGNHQAKHTRCAVRAALARRAISAAASRDAFSRASCSHRRRRRLQCLHCGGAAPRRLAGWQRPSAVTPSPACWCSWHRVSRNLSPLQHRCLPRLASCCSCLHLLQPAGSDAMSLDHGRTVHYTKTVAHACIVQHWCRHCAWQHWLVIGR